jgi:hypothetical protein
MAIRKTGIFSALLCSLLVSAADLYAFIDKDKPKNDKIYQVNNVSGSLHKGLLELFEKIGLAKRKDLSLDSSQRPLASDDHRSKIYAKRRKQIHKGAFLLPLVALILR